jgi:hypothetical protein
MQNLMVAAHGKWSVGDAKMEVREVGCEKERRMEWLKIVFLGGLWC